MKHHALVLLSLLFLAVPALASADTAATDLGAPAAEVSAACSAPAGLADLLRPDFAYQVCSASAECAPFTDVNCQGNSNCSVADRNCSVGQRGFVTCDGSTTYCGGTCCGNDGVCESVCGCSDPDCCDPCASNGSCNLSCGCEDPDCQGTKACPCPEIGPDYCSTVTNCVTNFDCCNPGSICTPSGICLCAS